MSASAAAARVVDPISAHVDEVQGAARREACARTPAIALVALAAAPLWTADALATIDVTAAILDEAEPLLRRDGHGDDEVIELDRGALPVVLAALPEASDRVALVRRIAASLAGARALPRLLAAWARLAALATDEMIAAADHVLAEVRAACERGSPGRALDLLEAAAALERVLPGPLTAALRIGRHRVEYAYRVARDLRHLDACVARRAPLAAFDALLAPDGPWALHYLGVGGVGKTTLLRQLEVVEAPRRGLVVARIDFDYLAADYPARDPGKLVEAIVHELSARIERTEQDHWLASIRDKLGALRTAAAVAPGADPVRVIEGVEFQKLRAFVAPLLTSFGRPLLVLDTCEELMKRAPVGDRVPSVEAMFALIEKLHEDTRGALRVVFAGRRLLAGGGAGWRAPAHPGYRGLGTVRDYLALHELRGFDRAEAEEALAQRLGERHDDRALVEAILAASPEDERASGVRREGDDEEARTSTSTEPAPEPERYSPYRVAAFGDWVHADPTVAVAQIGGGRDPYIEHRIVRRMGPLLEPLLPVVALLRRFDAATLAAVLGPEVAIAPIMEALAGNEWIDVAADERRGEILRAKPSIVGPLERYLRAARPAEWEAASRRVAAALAPSVVGVEAPLALPFELVDGYLRALPVDPAVAAWVDIEERIDRDRASAQRLLDVLLADDGAAADEETLLGAAVRATQAATFAHLGDDARAAPLWELVVRAAREATSRLAGGASGLALAQARGEASAAWRLLQRAQLGLAAARAWAGIDAAEQEDAVLAVLARLVLWNRLDELAFPAIAAVEAIVERAEADRLAPDPRLAALLANLRTPYRGAEAFVAMLRARLARLAGEEGEPFALPDGVDELPAATLDWRPPASLRARLQLEALRLRFHVDAGADERRALLASPIDPREGRRAVTPTPAAADDDDDDTAHLRVAIAMYEEARAPAPHAGVPTAERAPRAYRAHVRFPLDAHAAAQSRDGRLAIPREPPASEQLGWYRAAIDRATFAMDRSWLAPIQAIDTVRFDPAMARALAVASFEAIPLDVLLRAGVDLAVAVSSQLAATRAQLDELLAQVRPHVPELQRRVAQGPTPAALAAGALLEELDELSRQGSIDLAIEPPPLSIELAKVHPDDVELAARVALRALAAGRIALPREGAGLAGEPPPSTAAQREPWAIWLAALVRACPRRVGQLAYEEGQLLALRLPARAITLFDEAIALLDQTGDRIGAAAARLAAQVARARAGKPTDLDVHGALAGLASAQRDVLEPLVQRLGARADGDAFLARFERGAGRPPRPPRPARPSWWRRIDRKSVGSAALVVLLLGALIAATFVWVMPPFEDLLARHGIARTQAGNYAKGILLLLWFIGSAIGRVDLRIRDWWWRRQERALATRARIAYATSGELVVDVRTADGKFTAALPVEPPRAGRRPRWAAGAANGPSPSLAPLAARIERLAAVRRAKEPLAPPLSIDLTLDVEPALAMHGWESLLLSVSDAFAPRRAVVVRGARRTGRPDGARLMSPSNRALLGSAAPPPGVVHAIGRPVRGALSIALDIGEREPLSLAKLVPTGAPIVILQGTPEAATEIITDAYRAEVGELRELAVALVAQGAAEVVVIPPLPPRTMTSLDDALARLNPVARAQGRTIVHAVRAHLRSIADETHREAALEASWLVAARKRPE